MANKGRLTTGIFCLFLAGLLAWHIALPDRARSETENRTLAQFPDFSLETLKNGSFTAGMEDYFADQFPLRDDWTGLKAGVSSCWASGNSTASIFAVIPLSPRWTNRTDFRRKRIWTM